jgi:hypothetical protein
MADIEIIKLLFDFCIDLRPLLHALHIVLLFVLSQSHAIVVHISKSSVLNKKIITF